MTHRTAFADSPERIVRAALAAHPATQPLAVVALEPVVGGLSNHAWRAQQGERAYFIRLGARESERLGVDRRSECALLGNVAAAGLAPEVLACDPSNGLLVTHFVDGAPLRRDEARDARILGCLGSILSTLHRLARPADVRELSFEAQAAQLEAQIAASHGADARHVGEPVQALDARGRGGQPGRGLDSGLTDVAVAAFEALAARPERRALCHNDLHHLNILDDGDRLWLVDWEYGGWGDPLFDMASFLCQHECTPGERAFLVEAYGDGSVTDSELGAACTAFDYVQWLWYRLWAARHPDMQTECAARASLLANRLRAR